MTCLMTHVTLLEELTGDIISLDIAIVFLLTGSID